MSRKFSHTVISKLVSIKCDPFLPNRYLYLVVDSARMGETPIYLASTRDCSAVKTIIEAYGTLYKYINIVGSLEKVTPIIFFNALESKLDEEYALDLFEFVTKFKEFAQFANAKNEHGR